MALRTLLPTALLLVVALVLAACSAGAGSCDCDGDGAGCFLDDSLIGCAPPPAPGTPAEADDGTAFRAGLAPLLATLPSAAAATGFASLRSAGATGADRAHAFGICFVETDCVACLSAAVAAVTEGCDNDTRRAGAWRDGCLLAYADDDGSEGGGFQFLAGDQALADLARALAEPHGQSLWKKALSVLFYALAAVGAVAIVLLLCVCIAVFVLAQTLVHHSAAGANSVHAAAAGQGGEGITAYVVVTDGRSPLWSVGLQMSFH